MARLALQIVCCVAFEIFADVRNDGIISADIAKQALSMLDVDDAGFDYLDRKLLTAVIERFDGGPSWVR